MTDNAQPKTLITRYLLGQVSATERAELEDKYLNDDELFEELVAAENDMIDAYVRGSLSAPEQMLFETHFLVTEERRERVEVARSFTKLDAAPGPAVAAKPPRSWPGAPGLWQAQTPTIQSARIALLLATVAAFVWLAMLNRELRHQLKDARGSLLEIDQTAQDLRRQVAELREQAAQGDQPIADLPAPGSATLSVALAPGLVRSAGPTNTLILSAGISHVFLLLERAQNEGSAYRVVLETVEGDQVWRASGIRSRPARQGGAVVVVRISPHVVKRGDYVLRLFRETAGGKGTEIGTYSFRVLQR